MPAAEVLTEKGYDQADVDAEHANEAPDVDAATVEKAAQRAADDEASETH